MGLSAGGFFKNFVKGAAQQYNTNVAYVEQQKVEEEKAIAKENRKFDFDKRLLGIRLDTEAKADLDKAKKNKAFIGRYQYRKPDAKGNTHLNVEMMQGYKSLGEGKAKTQNRFYQLRNYIPQLTDLKKTLTPVGYSNLLNSIVDTYTGYSTVSDGKTQGTKVQVSYDPLYYKEIESNDDLFGVFSTKLQQTKEELSKYIIGTNPNALIDNKGKFKVGNNSVELTVDGFYGVGNERDFFKVEDIKTVKDVILKTRSTKTVIDFMNDSQKFMQQQTNDNKEKFGLEGTTFTGSDFIKAIAKGKSALSGLDKSAITNLTPAIGQTIRASILEMENGADIVNDPQVLHRVIKGILPNMINPPIQSINNQTILDTKQRVLIKKYGAGGAKVALNSVAKLDQSSRRLLRANSIVKLVDNGAGTGLAAGVANKTIGLFEQSKELIRRITGYKGGKNKLKGVASELQENIDTLDSRINNAPDVLNPEQIKQGQQTKDQIARDALLKFNATLMVFDIATMAQDAGGGFSSNATAVRLSDGDVRLSAGALANALLEIPGAVQIIAQQVAELAEQETVIFNMIANGDTNDTRAALVMLDAHRGKLGNLITNLVKDPLLLLEENAGDSNNQGNKDEGFEFIKNEDEKNNKPNNNTKKNRGEFK